MKHWFLIFAFSLACSDDNTPQTEMDAGFDFASPDIGQDADIDNQEEVQTACPDPALRRR